MTNPIDIDLTTDGILPPDILRQLDEIADRQWLPFNELIADLSDGRERDIDWWCTGTATRNNFVSPLFGQCVQLALSRELIRDGKELRVRVDNAEMAQVLTGTNGIKVEFSSRQSSLAGRIAGALHNIASCLFHALGGLLGARLSRKNVSTYPNNLILLDTFVLRDSIASGSYRDRYYPGLEGVVTKEEARRIYFVPIFYRIRNYIELFRRMRQAGNFIFMQDHLGLRDLLFAMGHWFRLGRHKGRPAQFAGFDITALVDADLEKGRFRQSSFQALLSYRFWRSFLSNHSVSRVIDWYEGQDIDHAPCAAIQWHHPGSSLVAFRPACSKFELSVFPTSHEVKCGVTPKVLSAVGRGFAAEIAAAVPALHVMTGPGMRYTRLAALTFQEDRPARILVTLPLLASAIQGLRALIDILDPLGLPSEIQWLIKRHPAMPEAEAKFLFGEVPKKFEFVDGDLYEWLPASRLVMGLESSALLESVAAGIPAICLARSNSPTKIPFPRWLDPAFWRVCYDGPSLHKAILELMAGNTSNNSADLAGLRDSLLSPATPNSTRALLGLDAN